MSQTDRVAELSAHLGVRLTEERVARAAGDVVKGILTELDVLGPEDPAGVYLRRGGIAFKGVLDATETPPSPGYWLRRSA